MLQTSQLHKQNIKTTWFVFNLIQTGVIVRIFKLFKLAMPSRQKLKECFAAEKRSEAFFTGTLIQWTKDGKKLLCHDNACINIYDLEESKVIATLGEKKSELDTKEDLITALTLSNDEVYVFVCHQSGLMHMYSLEDDYKLLKTWKSIHKGFTIQLACSDDNNWLVSGATDGTIMVWDLNTFSCTQSLKGCQGVISVLKIRLNTMEVYAAGDSNDIVSWKIGNSKIQHIYKSHYSTVTQIDFIENKMISCGRDSVICLWNINNEKALKVIPVYESLEDLIIIDTPSKLPGNIKLEANKLYVATIGEKAMVRVWDIERSSEIYTQSNCKIKSSEEKGSVVTHLLYNQKEMALAVVTFENNIIFHKLEDFECYRSVAGFISEVMDLILLGPEESHIAVATNSPDIKVYRLSDMFCDLINGHTATVLSLAHSKSNPCLFASGSKDNTVRVWMFNPETYNVQCVAIGNRHAGSVGAVSFGNLSTDILLSVAQDQCLKSWQITDDFTVDTELSLNTKCSTVAHTRDINCIDVSPNDKLLITSSQDKTIKLWSIDDLELIGVMTGHRKGVWCAKFSTTDQVVISSGADMLIKVWNLSDLSCIRTINCFDTSVLKLSFITNGTQIITAGGDGVLRLFTLKDAENPINFEGHTARIWALTVSKNESFVISGGSDSTIVIWKDVTKERKEEEQQKLVERITKEQQLANLIQLNQYEHALELALTLNRPSSTMKVLEGIMKKENSKKLCEVIRSLNEDSLNTLKNYTLTWNMNTRTCEIAQIIIEYLIIEDLVKFTPEELAQGIAYTDQHFRRLTELYSDIFFLKYTADCMSALPELMES